MAASQKYVAARPTNAPIVRQAGEKLCDNCFMTRRLHMIISGDVQGVGYRAWVLRWVKGKPITGWARNRQDKTVEVVAEGPQANLETLKRACQRGPEVAWVERVDATFLRASGEFIDFHVLY